MTHNEYPLLNYSQYCSGPDGTEKEFITPRIHADVLIEGFDYWLQGEDRECVPYSMVSRFARALMRELPLIPRDQAKLAAEELYELGGDRLVVIVAQKSAQRGVVVFPHPVFALKDAICSTFIEKTFFDDQARLQKILGDSAEGWEDVFSVGGQPASVLFGSGQPIILSIDIATWEYIVDKGWSYR